MRSSIEQLVGVFQMTENLYESLAPECDLSRERSSLPYYGSETESDIYCPYTFANSHKVTSGETINLVDLYFSQYTSVTQGLKIVPIAVVLLLAFGLTTSPGLGTC